MEKETTFTERAKKKFEKWEGMAQRLNLQLHLGAAEAKEAFETQKKELNGWLNEVKAQLDKTEKISKEKATELKTKVEALQVQAALGKAETKDEFEKQQKELTKNIEELKVKLKNIYGTTKDKGSEWANEVEEELEDYHTKFDFFRLQLHLGKEEAKEKYEATKKEMESKLRKVEGLLKKGSEAASDNWGSFSSDISKAWKQFREH